MNDDSNVRLLRPAVRDRLVIDPTELPEVEPKIHGMLTFNAAVMARLREVALRLDADAPIAVNASILGAALVHRLQELYRRARKQPSDKGVQELFQATSETISDLVQHKPPNSMCDLTAGDLLALIGVSAEGV